MADLVLDVCVVVVVVRVVLDFELEVWLVACYLAFEASHVVELQWSLWLRVLLLDLVGELVDEVVQHGWPSADWLIELLRIRLCYSGVEDGCSSACWDIEVGLHPDAGLDDSLHWPSPGLLGCLVLHEQRVVLGA